MSDAPLTDSLSRAEAAIEWPHLLQGTLIKRYKRFIADVLLSDHKVVNAHCPNSGSMKGCSEPGRPVWISQSPNPKRRLPYTWELIEMPGSLVCVNTSVTNTLVHRAIVNGLVPDLSGYRKVRREVKYGSGSRVDLVLDHVERPPCFVEVKSCTLVENGTARFPDAVTSRGLKHLKELQEQVRLGNRAVMFFVVQRMDAEGFDPADDIDPAYGKELRKSVENGVEILCHDVRLTATTMVLHRPVPTEWSSC